jgi:hypothetical protein
MNGKHRCAFSARFRRHAFGWRSQPAITRIREAVSEIKKAVRSPGLYREAIELANRTPCYPRTLARTARDMAVKEPQFDLEAGIAALRWLAEGYGYEITRMEVWQAYASTMKAADRAGCRIETLERIRRLLASASYGSLVLQAIGREQESSGSGGHSGTP